MPGGKEDPGLPPAGGGRPALEAGFAALGVLLGAATWVANQWPAILTLDTQGQLWEATGRAPLDTHHSVLMTLAMRALGTRMDVYLVLQIIAFAASFGLAISAASHAFGRRRAALPWYVPAGLGFLGGAFPGVGTMLNRIVKDVPFTIVLLAALTLLGLLANRRAGANRLAVLAGFLAGVLPWFRHDAIVVTAIAGLVAMAIAGPGWIRRALFLAGLGLGLGGQVLVERGAGARTVPVTRASYAIAFVGDIARLVHDEVPLTDHDRDFISRFTTEESLRQHFVHWAPDQYFTATPPLVDLEWLGNNRGTFLGGWVAMSARHPWPVLRHRIEFAGHILGVPPSITFESSCKTFEFSSWCGGPRGATATWLLWSDRFPPTHFLFWSTLWPLAALAAIWVLAIARSDRALIAFCTVPLGHTLVLLLFAPDPFFRYTAFLFPVAYVAIIGLWVARRRARGSAGSASDDPEDPDDQKVTLALRRLAPEEVVPHQAILHGHG